MMTKAHLALIAFAAHAYDIKPVVPLDSYSHGVEQRLEERRTARAELANEEAQAGKSELARERQKFQELSDRLLKVQKVD